MISSSRSAVERDQLTRPAGKSLSRTNEPYTQSGCRAKEFKLERGFPTFELAQQAVSQTIFTYNHKYPHGSLGYCTPDQVHNGKKPGPKNRTADAVEKVSPKTQTLRSGKNGRLAM